MEGGMRANCSYGVLKGKNCDNGREARRKNDSKKRREVGTNGRDRKEEERRKEDKKIKEGSRDELER